MDKNKIKSELQSIFDSMENHGTLIGIIHSINPDSKQESFLFFSDGYTMSTKALMIGKLSEEEKYNLLAAKIVIQCIPFLANKLEGDKIVELADKDELKSHIPKNSETPFHTFYYIFRPPENGLIKYDSCIGTWSLDEAIKGIISDPEAIVIGELE